MWKSNATWTLLFIAVIASSCGGSPSALDPASSTAPTESRSAIPTAVPTKPAFPTAVIATPTTVSWGIDKTGDAAHPYWFELYFDGGASAFRVIDGADQTVLRLPIAGSGIFDQSTCMARATSKSAGRNATWVWVDEPMYRRIVANAASYRVVVEPFSGAAAVTLALADSGCRP